MRRMLLHFNKPAGPPSYTSSTSYYSLPFSSKSSPLPPPSPFRKPSPSRSLRNVLRSPKLLMTRRYCRLLFALLFTASVFLLFRMTTSPSPFNLVLGSHKRYDDGTQLDLVPLPPPYPSPPSLQQQNGLPPLFEDWKDFERNFSQHGVDDPETKFIYMRNHVWASGWGNALQEMILNTHLAYLSNRAFVFDNYTWDRSPSDYSTFNGKTIPSRVPVSTMLAGPIIGGSFDPAYFNDPLFDVDPSPNAHPRFVSSEYYERVCAGQKTVIDTVAVRDAVGSWDGISNLRAWVQHLQALPERCVEFDLEAEHVFNIWMFGSTKFLSLWPSLSNSPILKQFTHSPLIVGAFERNYNLFGIKDAKKGILSSGFLSLVPSLGSFLPDLLFSSSSKDDTSSSTSLSSAEPLPPSLVPLKQLRKIYPHSPATPNINDTIPGLIALHVRRGDFEEHCVNLVSWGSEFNGFNSFEEIRARDAFDGSTAGGGTQPPGEPPVEPESQVDFTARLERLNDQDREEARTAYAALIKAYEAARSDYDDRKARYEAAKAQYLERCYPSIEQIVKRVREVREEVANATTSAPASKFRFHRSPSGPPTAPLTHLYVMTNGKPPFLAQLRYALETDAQENSSPTLPPWESIYTSRDLELGWEEGYVAQALDMYVAQRAEAFIGNGFSSLTSNIVMLRMANGVDTIKTRLW